MDVSLNSTARSALSLLTGSRAEYDKTLTKVATGRDVDTAKDNAAFWSIAKMMDSTVLSNSAAQDAIGFSQAITDVTAMGVSAASDIVTEIRSKLILAASLPGGRDAINGEIGQLKEQLKSIADSSGFGGENWLKLGAGEQPSTKQLVASVTSDPDGNSSVNTIDLDSTGVVLTSEGDADDGLLTAGYGVTTRTGGTYTYHLLDAGSQTPASGSTEIAVSEDNTADEIAGMIAATDKILSSLSDAGVKVGATQATLTAQNEFLYDLNDATTSGVGSLVDTDLEEQSANLAAQRVQAQLQTQMLNMANFDSKKFSQLFR
jgi:flagellin